jgi:uncharacterized membrane protein
MMFQMRPQSRDVFWIEQQLFTTYQTEQRQSLLKLLLRELDSLAHDTETLRPLENLVSQCRTRVDRQREIIAEDERAGRDTKASKFLLVTMLTTLALYVERHARISRGC